ncbi:MAG: MBL fold metallo-hydrolase [Galbitalea sp.]
MRITKYEHACFVASIGEKKLVVDPGSFTVPLPESTNVVAVVVTHEHGDHWTAEHLHRILENSPDVKFFGPAGVAAAATDFDFTVVHDGPEGRDRAVHPAILRREARRDPLLIPDRRQRRGAHQRRGLLPRRLLHPGTPRRRPPRRPGERAPGSRSARSWTMCSPRSPSAASPPTR